MMEIERNPTVPELTETAVELLTELCFRKNDELKEVDGIFLYASTGGMRDFATLVTDILSKNISKQVFITGGLTPPYLLQELHLENPITEADGLLSLLHPEQYKDLQVFVERKSTNTLENVTETFVHPEFLACKSLLFVFKSHAAGRGYLTLRKFFPQTDIIQQTFDTKYPQAEKEISRDNWHTFDFGRGRVWGEFLRIKTYGSRGDIEYDSVRDLVEKIEKETERS